MMNGIKQKYQSVWTFVPIFYVVTQQHSCFLPSEKAVSCHSPLCNVKNNFHTLRFITGNISLQFGSVKVSVFLLFD